MKRLLVVFLFALASAASLMAQARVYWYVVQGTPADSAKPTSIGDTAQEIKLGGGWSCTVAAPSMNSARQTLCSSGEKKFEFTVQCETVRPKDHTQIRFKDSKGKNTDYIEVGCELAK